MTWEGELYLEAHNGTYTSMAEHKHYNRFMEQLLRDTEMLLTIAYLEGLETKIEMQEMWRLFLID